MLNTTNELIPISENNGKRAVNARDLHAFLESKRDFSTWIKDRIKSYDFIEGIDFQSFHEIVEREVGATKRIEYAISISMAKELSMIENNERGKQARKYFIACEENKHELSRKELALMVLQAEEEREKLMTENQLLISENTRLLPKATFVDKIIDTGGKIDVGQAAKLLKLPFGRNKLFEELRKTGIFFKNRNEPKQQYIESGYFELREQYIERKDHPGFTVIKVLVTQKGLEFLNRLLNGEKSDGKMMKLA